MKEVHLTVSDVRNRFRWEIVSQQSCGERHDKTDADAQNGT